MRYGLTVILLVSALTLSGCAVGQPTGRQSTPGPVAGDGFPVTIDQMLGPVTIERRPTRVVALDFPSADAAIALGVVPVGMSELSYVEGGIQQWTQEALRGQRPELIDTERGFPIEAIAALRPDVILATNTYPLIAESWKELNAVAPVVGHVEAPGVDTWQQGVRQVGQALGLPQEAARLIAEAETAIGTARKMHPEFSGRTVSLFNYVSQGLYVVNDEADFSIKFFKELGFAGVTDAVAGLPGQDGRALVSPERYALLDADVILGTSGSGRATLDELANHELFTRIPAVARGRYLALNIGPATALAFPSVLGVRYAVEKLVPRVSRAIRSP